MNPAFLEEERESEGKKKFVGKRQKDEQRRKLMRRAYRSRDASMSFYAGLPGILHVGSYMTVVQS